MNPVKRFRFVGLLLILGMLLAVSQALAGKGGSTAIPLTPPSDSPEPQAAGQYTVKPKAPFGADVTVNCWNLTPRQTYTVRCYDGHYYCGTGVTTDRKGGFRITLCVDGSPVFVWVQNADGHAVLR